MVDLLQGISYVPVMIGLFGFAEVLGQVYENKKDERDQEKKKIGRIIPTWKMIKDFFPLTTISALVSVIVGAIPGAGGDIASIICWDQCKKVSKDKENYGKMCIRDSCFRCIGHKKNAHFYIEFRSAHSREVNARRLKTSFPNVCRCV